MTDEEEGSVAARFDELMGRLDHPMVVVTTASGDEQAGCLVGFHAQCGMEPPYYAVWISKANHTYRVGALAEVFAVHFLGADQHALAELFGATTGDDLDKFARCSWSAGPDGVPVLDEVADRFVGRRVAFVDAGTDHVCLVVAPIDARSSAGELLWFGSTDDITPGHDAGERQRGRDRAPEKR